MEIFFEQFPKNFYLYSDGDDDDEGLENRATKQEQAKIDSAQPLTKQEKAEKNFLLTQGFGNWTKAELKKFVKGIKRYKSENLIEIAKCVPTKTLEQVVEYSKVFWKRNNEITDNQEIVESIEIHKGYRPIPPTPISMGLPPSSSLGPPPSSSLGPFRPPTPNSTVVTDK